MASLNRKTSLLIFFILLFICANCIQIAESPAGEKKTVYFKGNHFFVELAQTKQEQENGLMFTKRLEPDSGMLFVYQDEARRSFYMKNTYIPLDIIWINKEKKVVFIKKNAGPESSGVFEEIYPQEKAMYVLELSAGSSDKNGLKVGDELQF